MAVVVPPEVWAFLSTLPTGCQLSNESGRLLGTFTPPDPGEPPITEEEIQRRERETGGRILEQIVADLERRP